MFDDTVSEFTLRLAIVKEATLGRATAVDEVRRAAREPLPRVEQLFGVGRRFVPPEYS